MSNVVELRKGPQGYTVAEDVMNAIRVRMYAYETEWLADEVGVSKGCIMAIRSGRTLWPRPKTFFGLLRVLDLKVAIIDSRGRKV